MNKITSDTKLKEKLQSKYERLSEEASDIIRRGGEEAKNYYNSLTHNFLETESLGGITFKREIFLPMERRYWPCNFVELENNYSPAMQWPNYSLYCYCMDVACPPLIPSLLLNFGYAVYKDKLIRCPFFEGILMTEQSLDGKMEMFPESFAIDPLAFMNDEKPECYIGMSVDKDDIINWFATKTVHPLEGYIKRKVEKNEAKRLYEIHYVAYITQITYAPGWFSRELLEFAEEHDLAIPEQNREFTDDGWKYKRLYY